MSHSEVQLKFLEVFLRGQCRGSEISVICIVRDKAMIVVQESIELFHFVTVVWHRISSDCSQLLTIMFSSFDGYHMAKVGDLLLDKMTFLRFQFQTCCSELIKDRHKSL